MTGIRLRLCVTGLFAAVVAGCQTLPPSLVPCPMPVVEQAAKIQQLVPVGTPREDAISLLNKVGIDGQLSTGNSIYYCDTWQRGEKERWHINVELMFDEAGQVYAYRPDPQQYAAAKDAPGTAKVAKTAKEIAAGPKPSVVDPFAE